MIIVIILIIKINVHAESLKNPSVRWDEMMELTVLITTKVGWGSGILLTPSLALTCNHVITNPQSTLREEFESSCMDTMNIIIIFTFVRVIT